MANKAGRPGPPTPWSAKPLIDPTAIINKAGRPTRSASESDSASDSEDEDDDDDDEEIEEDEYGAELTPALDAAILRTLAKIRSKTGVYAGERVLDEELKEAEEKARQAGVKGGVVRRSEGKVSGGWLVFGMSELRLGRNDACSVRSDSYPPIYKLVAAGLSSCHSFSSFARKASPSSTVRTSLDDSL
jgi:hypothetical protein